MHRCAWIGIVLAAAFVASWGLMACGGGDDDDEEDIDPLEDDPPPDAESLLEDQTGYAWSFSAADVGVAAPDGWHFLFAIELDETQAGLIDGGWAVDFEALRDELAAGGVSFAETGFDLSELDHMIVMTKADEGARKARFVQKLRWADGVMTIDNEAASALGEAAGSAGAGWYVAYASDADHALAAGRISAGCPGRSVEEQRVHGGPDTFASRPSADGAFALPAPAGVRTAVLTVVNADCATAFSIPMTNTAEEPNPKCDVVGTPDDCGEPESIIVSDGTLIVNAGTIDPSYLAMPEAADEDAGDDFEDGDANGWTAKSIGGADCLSATGDSSADLFPGGGAFFAAMTDGGDGARGCLAARTFAAPEGAETLVVSYDVLTQDAPEWVGSPYADAVFIVVFDPSAGDDGTGPAVLVRRAATDEATGDDWADAPASATDILGIDASADAAYNEGGAAWDAHLVDEARGSFSDSHAGDVARMAVDSGEITVILGVLDTADVYWDTALLVDAVAFE